MANKTQMQRKQEAKLKDLEQLAELIYRQGYTQLEAARQLGVSQSTVSRDLAKVRRLWLEGALERVEEAIERELAVLDRLEAEAWAAWFASQEPRVTTMATGAKGGPVASAKKTVEERAGDPRFLTLVRDCVDRRMELLGMKRVLVGGTVQHEHTVSVDRYAAVFREMRDYDRKVIDDGGLATTRDDDDG